MFKINKKANQPIWVKFDQNESVEILISPISIYSLRRLPSQEKQEVTVEDYAYILDKVTIDWKGVYDQDSNPLECNTENKRLLADAAPELAIFIMNTATELKNKNKIDDAQVKN